MAIKKGEEIKIRVTLEQKELIKRVAKEQGLTMSAFVLKYIEPIALGKELDLKHKEIISNRIEDTEGKIQILKGKMETKKGNTKKSIFESIFARKL
ncbi:DUF1778 domain-containing protein [Clostridium perfringens]|nr:DUF1778 domain-containing protein [Clostridium perfringens]